MSTHVDIAVSTEYYVYRAGMEFIILDFPFEDVYKETHVPDYIGLFTSEQAMYDWLAQKVSGKDNREQVIRRFLKAHDEFIRQQQTL